MALCTSARAWEAVSGLKTKKMTVTPAPEGSPTIAKGDTITVHATGVVKETDKKFWSTKDPGQQPFTYNAGVGSVTTCVESDFGRPTPSTRRASVAASARWRGDSTPSTRRRPRGRVEPPTSPVDFHSGDYGLGPGIARCGRRRGEEARHPGRGGLRQGRLPGVGHPSERRPLLRDRGALDQGQVGGALVVVCKN